VRVMREVDHEKILQVVQKLLPDLPFRIELPLTYLERILWPQSSENELKFRGKLLAYILRKHGAIITKRNGVRFVSLPRSFLLESKKKQRTRKAKKPSSEKTLVDSVWPW